MTSGRISYLFVSIHYSVSKETSLEQSTLRLSLSCHTIILFCARAMCKLKRNVFERILMLFELYKELENEASVGNPAVGA